MVDASVTATVDEDSGAVDLSFTVRNPGEESVECSFRDGQRIEAVAEREAGTGDDGESEAWRYGDGQLFAMALGTETIPAGGDATFDATWPDPAPGEYRVRVWLADTNVDASAETRVSVA